MTAPAASALAIAALAWPALALQQVPFRSRVDLISVDALVVGRDGAPMNSLDADRFEVSINGSRRRVVSAEFIGVRAEAVRVRPRTTLPGGVGLNIGPATGPGQTIVLAVDCGSFEVDTWQRVMATSRSFLSALTSNDQVGLFAYPFGPVRGATTDRTAIMSALASTRVASAAFRTTFHLSPSEIIDISAEMGRSTSPGTAIRRASGVSLEPGSDVTTVRRVQDRECPNDPNCSARILMDAQTAVSRLEARAAQSFSGLQSLLTMLAAMPGRKTVILVTGGMPVSDVPGGRPQMDDLARTLGDMVARSNSTIYTLQIDNLPGSAISATNQRITLGTTDLVRERMLSGRWLEQFSVSAGGTLIRAENDDGEAAFERILMETAGYYLLGVEPQQSDRDGKFRALKVRVQANGATVRHRSWVSLN